MSFNWWKKHEEKPHSKSRYPIKITIEPAAQDAEKPSGYVETVDADNPSIEVPRRLCKEEKENG